MLAHARIDGKLEKDLGGAFGELFSGLLASSSIQQSKYQSITLTTVKDAIAKSQRNRPTNFQLLKKRSVKNVRPTKVSAQETTRMATDMPFAILTGE